MDSAAIRMFDTFRKKRNITDYERADTISDIEADKMHALAKRLRRDIFAWIFENYPDLKP